ncbi:MAG TPA: SpoIIE family protein phosphatase [Bacteroidales bacterium]|nr:SpoIIE family protein phosphatase [Bacteroidales bacterium]
MKKYRSLTARLTYTISAIVLAIFIIIVFINFWFTRSNLLEDAHTDARNISALIVSEIQQELLRVELPTKYLAGYLSQDQLDSDEIAILLQLLTTNNERIPGGFAVYFDKTSPTDNQPNFLFYQHGAHSDTMENAFVEKLRTWAMRLKTENKPFWSEAYKNAGGNELSVAYLVPAYLSVDDSTRIRGMIGVELRLSWLREVIEKRKQHQRDYVFILSQQGKPLVRPRGEANFENDIYQTAKQINNPDLVMLADQMLAGHSGFVTIDWVFENFKSLVYYMPVAQTGWSVAVVFPKRDLLSDLYLTTIITTATGIVGFLLIIFTILLITRRLTRPLQQLSQSAREIGQGNLTVEMPAVPSNDEVMVLKDSLETMQTELQAYIKNLMATQRYKDRVEGELRVAHDIQMGYLRSDFTNFCENRNFNIAATLKPALQIGGDFYDFFDVNEHTVCFAMGDVAGKGIPAALFMAIALTLTRSAAYATQSLSKIVGRINDILVSQNENAVFTTFFIGLLDTRTGAINFCNAGHNYPYLLQQGELYEVKATHGPALGVVDQVSYKTGKLQMNAGDKLVLYTDGVTDAENSENIFFSKENLELVLTSDGAADIRELLHGLMQQLKKFTGNQPPSDDITVMALQWSGSEEKISNSNSQISKDK